MADEKVVTAESIAIDTMAKIEAAKKKAPEQKPDGKASVEKPVHEEVKKTAEELSKEAAEKAEAEAKGKEPHKKTDEEKQASIDARMAELTAKAKKAEEEKTALALERDQARKEKADLEAKFTPKETPQETIKKAEKARIEKYLEEDKALPKEDRREMSKEELDNWLVEDYSSASSWIADRAVRRREEKVADERVVAQKSNMEKFSKYMKEGIDKHPELDTTKRIAELKGQGKSEQEIKDTILKENVKVRTVLEVLKDHPEYLRTVEGPKLAREEMEKRLESSKDDIKDTDKEELKAKLAKIEQEKADLEAEMKRRDGIDSDTKSSRRDEEKPSGKKLTEFEEEQEKIRNKSGISKERLDAVKARRSKIPGASIRDKDDQ